MATHTNTSTTANGAVDDDSSIRCETVMASSTLTLLFILFVVLFLAFMMYFMRYKVDIFAMLHSRNWMPPATITTEDKKYDGFLCYDKADQATADELAKNLEPNGSRLCVPSRDWATGGEFSRNIDTSMGNSWATLLLLTKNSAANIPFQEEFRNAYIKLKDDKTHKLILIKSTDYEVTEGMVEEFIKLLRGKTTVVWGEKLFWEKLRYLVRPKVTTSSKEGDIGTKTVVTPVETSSDKPDVVETSSDKPDVSSEDNKQG